MRDQSGAIPRELYQVLVLQTGSLPLRPDETITSVSHACTATLVWPESESPARENSVIVDPSFNGPGWRQAETALRHHGTIVLSGVRILSRGGSNGLSRRHRRSIA